MAEPYDPLERIKCAKRVCMVSTYLSGKDRKCPGCKSRGVKLSIHEESHAARIVKAMYENDIMRSNR